MEIDQLLERFGNDTGLGWLALDDADTCTFLVDDMKISIMSITEGGRLLLFADVGEIPEDGRAALSLAALRANYLFRGTAGATLAVCPDSPTLMLNQSMRLDTLSYEQFVQALDDFTSTLEEWKRMLADYRPAPPDAAGDTSQTEPFISFGSMRI